MQLCQKHNEYPAIVICCASCSRKASCSVACMNDPTVCNMGKIEQSIEEPIAVEKDSGNKQNGNKKARLKVINLATGEERLYRSVSSAAKELNCHNSTIYNHIQNGVAFNGFKFEFLPKGVKG